MNPFRSASSKTLMLLVCVTVTNLAVRASDAPKIHEREAFLREMFDLPTDGMPAAAELDRMLPPGKSGWTNAELEQLSRLIMRQFDPRQWDELVYGHASVQTRAASFGPLGNPGDRMKLVERLASSALASKSPDTAKLLARAALVLMIADGQLGHISRVNSLLKDKKLNQPAGLNEQQTRRYIERTEALSGRLGEVGVYPMAKILNPMIEAHKHKDAEFDRGAAREFIREFSRRVPVAGDDLTLPVHALSNLAWQMKCLAKASGQQEIADEVAKAATTLAQQSDVPLHRRWLTEVATLDGPAPEDSGHLIITSPDQLKPQRGP
jgi:hypothetical protein